MLTWNPSFFSQFIFDPVKRAYDSFSQKEKIILVISTLATAILSVFFFYKIQQPLSQWRWNKVEREDEAAQKTREAAGRYFPIKGQFDPDYLNRFHQRLQERWMNLMSSLRNKESWKDPAFIKQFSALMEKANEEINLIFHQVDELTEGVSNKAERMARILASQGEYNFCYKYFRYSVTQFYHLARNYTFINRNRYVCPNEISDTEKTVFFTPGTPQYRWREIYLNFCQKLDQYEMKEEMRRIDQRFVHWAEPDLDWRQPFPAFPDTTPT